MHHVQKHVLWSSTFAWGCEVELHFGNGRQSFDEPRSRRPPTLAIVAAAAQLQPIMATESGETPRRMLTAPRPIFGNTMR